MTIRRRISLLSAVLALALPACAQVQIFVWQENQPDRVVYHYRVVNTGEDRMHSFEIGLNGLTEEMELSVWPVGFVDDDDAIPQEMIGMGFPIPAGSAGAPAGWERAFILGDGDTPGASLHYYIDTATALGPGTLRDFTVALPVAENVYRTGHWRAVLERGIVVPGNLLPDDEAPAPTAIVSGGGSACSGTTLQVAATLSGNGPWNITWSDGLNATVTTNTTTRSVTPATAWQYTISRITDVNRQGTSSGVAYADIQQVASIQTQPQSVTIPKRSTATLSVVAGGGAPYTYQWYRGTSGQTGTPVGTGASFTTPKLTGTTSYWVRVSNRCGSVDSQTAAVSVQ